MGAQGGGAPERAPAHLGLVLVSLGLAGRLDEANEYKAKIRERVPNYGMADFLAAFRFAPEDVERFKRGGQRIGIK